MEIFFKIETVDNQKFVSTRELYEFLRIKSNFNVWCKKVIKPGLEEGLDYLVAFSINREKLGDFKPIDYLLSIDYATEICILQKSEKGRMIRKYLIEREKMLRNHMNNLSRLELAQMVIDNETELERLEEEQSHNKPFKQSLK